MSEKFYTILTNAGKAKIANASTLGTKVTFTHFALGDGGGSYYNPTENQKNLVNEVWRGKIGSIAVDKENPNWIVIEIIIPASIGGFMIREAGVFDDEGNLLAVGKYPETYKPVVADGSAKDLCVRMILEVANTSVVNLKIDPTIILATKKDIDVLSNRITKNENDITGLKKEVNEHKAEMTQLIKIKKDITISSANWIDDTANSGFWIYDIRDTDIDVNTIVDVNIDLNDLEKASSIKSVTDSFNEYVRLYADEQPTEDILCDLRLTRQVVVNEG